VRVIGLGQPAAGDDGAGPAVIAHLRATGGVAGAELHDAAEASALVPLLQGARRAIVVDAVVAAGRIGEVRLLSPDALAAGAMRPVSSHGIGAVVAIDLARMLDAETTPEGVEIVAIVIAPPREVGADLSPEVRAAVPEAAALVRSLAAR
jgi:hydrogenase maturation protease